LLYFVWEREAIRLARENGHAAPWTKDPVLARYKFTNIRRRDDRVSRWVIEHIIKPREHSPHLWFMLLIARLINWPPTLQHLIDDGILFRTAGDFEPVEFSRSIENFNAQGNKAYTGAYMVYPTKMDPGGVKSLAIARHIIAPARELGETVQGIISGDRPSIADVVSVLSSGFGISTFIAGQVAADLTYCAQLDDAVDLYSYAPIGPGSQRGLNYLLGRKPFATWQQDAINGWLIRINDDIKKELQIEDLTLHDVQNVMCEYSKYCRVVLSEGTPKTVYRSETEF
jgi:hypothetical protein